MVRITILTVLSLAVLGVFLRTTTNAFFTDSAVSDTNVFAAATEFQTPMEEETPPGTPSGKIVINEVSPVGNGLVDWVELYNSGGTSIDITGWKIGDNNSTETLPGSFTLPSGGYAVIVASGSSVVVTAPAQRIELISTAIGNALNEDGDLVKLLSDTDTIIDAMSFGSNETIFTLPILPKLSSDQTLRRIPNGVDTDIAGDWVVGESSMGKSN